MSTSSRPAVALVASNGRGLGHLSRELAIALALDDHAAVAMFTFSRGLPLATQFGLRGEFCPNKTSPWISPGRWDEYVERRFGIFLDEVEPDVVLFDGVAPYVGVLNALRKRPGISAGWLRRGMWLRGPNDAQLHKSDQFDFIVEPGDLAAPADHGPTATLESIRVPPVSLLEVIPTVNRDEAAKALGLDASKPALLFTLGASRPGKAATAANAAIDQVLRHGDWQVAVVRSPLSDPTDDVDLEGATKVAETFPLSRLLPAFDAAISAAGYNSVHELIPAGIPTLLIPNTETNTDNQVARASYLAGQDLALLADERDPEQVAGQVERLLGDAAPDIAERLAALDPEEVLGGARTVAAVLTSSPPTGHRETGSDPWQQPGFKGLVKRAIGPKRVGALQEVLRERVAPSPRRPVSLKPGVGSSHLLVSADPADVTRSLDQPVEHMLADSSAAYRTARHNLIDEFYDLVG